MRPAMSRLGPARTATSSRARKPLLRKSSSVRAIARPPVFSGQRQEGGAWFLGCLFSTCTEYENGQMTD